MPGHLVESDAVIKTLLYIFVLCYIFIITFWSILNVHLVSYDLSFTVNFQWRIQFAREGVAGVIKKVFPSPHFLRLIKGGKGAASLDWPLNLLRLI